AMFDEKRHEGEWFEADDEMLAFIEQARIWTPQPPRVLVDVPAPQVVEVKVPTPFVVQPEPAAEPEPEPEPEPEDEGWHQTPKMDIYIGVFFVAMATLMIAGTVIALASSGWRVDLNTGRWMLSYPFMFGVGIHLIKRSVAKL